jgi:heterodisulfide reductase subunit A-like polyferredoxin
MTSFLHSSIMATNIVACVLGLLALSNALQIPRHATRISKELVSATEYDFIVVGGGVSGLTVADRLTEDPSSNHHQYLLL